MTMPRYPGDAAGTTDLSAPLGTGVQTAPATPPPAAPVQPALQGPAPYTNGSVQALQAYDEQYNVAKQAWSTAAENLAKTKAALDNYQPANAQLAQLGGDAQQKALQEAYQTAQTAFDHAQTVLNSASADRAKAYQQAAASDDPTTRAYAAATASKAQTDADSAAAAYKEWQAAAPDRKAAVAAQQRLASIQADQAQLNLDFQRATDPQQKAILGQQVQAGQVAVQKAQLDLDTATKTQGNQVALSNQSVQAGQQGLTQGELNIQDLARQVRQAPTDEQAQQALQTALAQGQANLASTQQQNQQNAQLFPGALAQQGANLASTQAGTQATKEGIAASQQGTLYGLDQYIAQQKDAIARGLISPEQADAALQARIAGTTASNAALQTEQALENRTSQGIQQRQQDVGLIGNRMSTFGSLANQGLSTLAGMNTYAPKGSTAGASAVGGYVQAMLNAMGGTQAFQTPPQVQQPALPLLQGYTAQGAGPAQQPSQGHSITINIGGTNAGSEPANTGNAVNPATGQPWPTYNAQSAPPAMLAGKAPASPQDILDSHAQLAQKYGLPMPTGNGVMF